MCWCMCVCQCGLLQIIRGSVYDAGDKVSLFTFFRIPESTVFHAAFSGKIEHFGMWWKELFCKMNFLENEGDKGVKFNFWNLRF